MVLLAAYKAMLYPLYGENDIIVGGVTDTRRRPELQPLMGYFLNTMPLHSRPACRYAVPRLSREVKASGDRRARSKRRTLRPCRPRDRASKRACRHPSAVQRTVLDRAAGRRNSPKVGI